MPRQQIWRKSQLRRSGRPTTWPVCANPTLMARTIVLTIQIKTAGFLLI